MVGVEVGVGMDGVEVFWCARHEISQRIRVTSKPKSEPDDHAFRDPRTRTNSVNLAKTPGKRSVSCDEVLPTMLYVT